MPGLIGLPNELQHRIIQFIEPEDLEAFTRSCRHNYSLAKDAYYHYKKSYTMLQYGTTGIGGSCSLHRSSEDCQDPRLLVQSILAKPHMVSWPTMLEAGALGCPHSADITEGLRNHIEQILLRVHSSVRDKRRQQLENMAHNIYPIAPALKTEINDLLSQSFTQNMAICLLVTLLPNLTSLTFSSWSQFDILDIIVQRVARANRDPNSPSHGKALTKLQHVSIIHWDTEGGVDIDSYCAFAMLPSMRSLYGNQIIGDEELNWPIGSLRSSTITSISFRSSAISAQSFRDFSSGIAALKDFTYEFGGPIIGYAPYEPAGIIDALRQHACHSLESMDIQGMEQTFGSFEEEEVEVSLRDFASLKTIRLEDILFCKQVLDNSSSEDDDQGGRRFVGVGSSGSEDPPDPMNRLIDILPASIESVTLIPAMANDRTTDLLQGLPELKEKKVPELRRLALEYRASIPVRMKERLKSIGIELFAGDRYSHEVFPM